ELHHLFTDFGRGRKHSDDGKKGMGIGLSVCASIVKEHGCTISGENKPAGGCLFRFTLPREEEKNEQQV
ncbi:MAG: sensor histidine kinase, partial [Clostridiales bacterium]|nr:sensor histidine kinase [Clostridiales bacterium]